MLTLERAKSIARLRTDYNLEQVQDYDRRWCDAVKKLKNSGKRLEDMPIVPEGKERD